MKNFKKTQIYIIIMQITTKKYFTSVLKDKVFKNEIH